MFFHVLFSIVFFFPLQQFKFSSYHVDIILFSSLIMKWILEILFCVFRKNKFLKVIRKCRKKLKLVKTIRKKESKNVFDLSWENRSQRTCQWLENSRGKRRSRRPTAYYPMRMRKWAGEIKFKKASDLMGNAQDRVRWRSIFARARNELKKYWFLMVLCDSTEHVQGTR